MDQVNFFDATFNVQAYDTYGSAVDFNQPFYLDWMVGYLPLTPMSEVLDVASGTGEFSRYIAPFAKKVVALDASSHCVEVGAMDAQNAGIDNINFVNGLAENLPDDDDHFDIVVSRFSIHQFPNPIKQLKEMKRVLKPDGSLCIIDMIAPYSLEIADNYNNFERRRDPAHTVALTEAGLKNRVKALDVQIERTEKMQVDFNLNDWAGLAHNHQADVDAMKTLLLEEIDGGVKTGLSPSLQAGEIMVQETWLGIIVKK